MLAVAETLSPSWSVTVAVRVTRLSAARVTGSSGLAGSGWTSARCWSSVTVPAESTLMANTMGPPAPARPSTWPASSVTTTALPVAVSTSPLAPAVTPSA